MVTLQDAIERAKLATDDAGLLSAETYDRLLDQLSFEDRHAFTMALVDLGIVTKYGSVDDADHMKEVLGISSEEDFKEVSRQIDIIEEFVKVSQQFVQGPGGLWVPESPEEFGEEEIMPEEDPQDSIFEQMYDEPLSLEEAPGADTQTMPEFIDYDISDAVETLESSGIFVGEDGKVNLYSTNIPGLFMDEVPTRAMSIGQAINLFNNQAKSFSNQQAKVMELQDVLSAMGSDFNTLEQSVEDLIGRFNQASESLDLFKYSPQSKNEVIKEIGQGVKSLKESLDDVDITLDEDLVYGLNQNVELIENLQSNLDTYSQSQYDSYEQKVEVVDALQRLKGLRDENPEGFAQVVSGMGGIAAAFKELY